MESTSRKMETEHLNRGLKNRHMQLIAIGGAIGTGLFYGASSTIGFAGPAVILAYLFFGVAIYFTMRALGELAVAEPVSGSYVSYSSRYITPFAGFFLGWNILIGVAAGSAAEYNAIGKYVQFWLPHFPIWITAVIVVGLISVVNIAAVKLYGEAEYWMSIIKVVAIIAMIVLGLAMILFGLGNGGHPIGLSNLTHNGGFFPKGISGWTLSLVLVAFAFGGVESVGVTAGEAKDVKKSIPKAINGVFWRIMIFYVGAIFVIVSIYNWKDIGTAGSPFVLVFSKMGIPAAASIINLVVITAGISGMNSGIYVTTRYAYNLSLQGNAPAVFRKLNRNNVPFLGVLVVIGLQLVGVLINFIMPASAFSVFSSIVVISLVAGWLAILLSQQRFRRIKRAAGETIEFKMPWWPYSSYVAIAVMLFVVAMMWRLSFTRVALYVFPVELVVLLVIYWFTRNRRLMPSVLESEATVTPTAP